MSTKPRIKPLIVFGAGVISEVAIGELKSRGFEVDLVCVDEGFLGGAGSKYRNLVPVTKIKKLAPPETHDAFVAVGYQDLNRLRAAKVTQLKALGYRLVSCGAGLAGGQNSLVAQSSTVQAKATIGENTFVWSEATVGHHSKIGDDSWISSGATIGGKCWVGEGCFVGLGAVVTHEVKVGARSIIGAGAVVNRDLPEESVVLSPISPVHRMRASQFNLLFPL